VERVIVSDGTWAGEDAVGYLCLSGQNGYLQTENINVGANLNVATFTTAPAVDVGIWFYYGHVTNNSIALQDINIDGNLFDAGNGYNANSTTIVNLQAGASAITGVNISNNRIIANAYARGVQLQTNGVGSITRIKLVNNSSQTTACDALLYCSMGAGAAGTISDILVQGNDWANTASKDFCWINDVAVSDVVFTRNNSTLASGTGYWVDLDDTATLSDVEFSFNDMSYTAVSDGAPTSMSIFGNNDTTRPVIFPTAADTYTITTMQNGATFTNAGDDDAQVPTLPAAVPPLSFTLADVVDTAGVDLAIDCVGTDNFVKPDGTAMADAEQYQSENDTFAKVTATCYVAGIWQLENEVGTWVEETPP